MAQTNKGVVRERRERNKYMLTCAIFFHINANQEHHNTWPLVHCKLSQAEKSRRLYRSRSAASWCLHILLYHRKTSQTCRHAVNLINYGQECGSLLELSPTAGICIGSNEWGEGGGEGELPMYGRGLVCGNRVGALLLCMNVFWGHVI